MTKWLLTRSAMKVFCVLVLFAPLISFAQPRYNVVKDYGFENNDTIWIEYKSDYALTVNRHAQPGYESKYSGLTDGYTSPPGATGYTCYCYLEQKLNRREAKDYNIDRNFRYSFKIYPADRPTYLDYWYISVSSSQKKLIFLHAGPSAGKLPEEDDTTHIVKLTIPTTDAWLSETLNFYDKWFENFSDTDTIVKLRLVSYTYLGGFSAQGQKIWWDDIVFESTRPDSDVAMVDIGFSGNPSAKVENKGAVIISFPVICDIFKGGSRVYSDTVNIDSLAVDSIKQVSFKPYSDTGEMKVYTILPGDQNPSNDTLSKNLGVQEVVVKKPLEFKVWPVLTKGQITITSSHPIQIYDARGSLIEKDGAGVGKFTLKATGVYFVKSGNDVKKIIRVE